MNNDDPLSFEQSKEKLLRAIDGVGDLTFVRGFGNIGDLLIHAGVRQLLVDLNYREVSILELGDSQGDTAVFPGAGGFCHAHHKIPSFISQVEKRFERVIILPSSFDVSVESVRSYLQTTKAHVFAREPESYRQIFGLCHSDLAHDCAFYFNFEPYKRSGHGPLIAYRTDGESALGRLPDGNNDISQTCETLDEFLWTIARHELIRTDRAHVMIAAAMLGKRVEYWTSNYHKIPALAEFSLSGYPVFCTEPEFARSPGEEVSSGGSTERQRNPLPGHNYWPHWIRLMALDVGDIVPPLKTCILVDNLELGELPVYNRRFLPFLERNGQYWGNPTDSNQAIEELERLREDGAAFIIFAWTAFWWFDCYPEFTKYLCSRYRCRLENERVRIFDLQSGA